MSSSWIQRKARLRSLLGSREDETQEGVALDSLLHGQSVIGRTSKTSEVDRLRFSEKDLEVAGALARGQFGTVELIRCRLDGRLYVRKTISKKTALKAKEQCFPQTERHILLLALRDDTVWVPQMLCAFQDPTSLSIVMEYAEGGSLWDVVESSVDEGKISEEDLRWWVPQCVSAIYWCHSQGFAHRDIKPHNFVLKASGHILLIDFASAAPLLPVQHDGTQMLPKRYCMVPCGTCDYISPEILRAHEEALVALEMSDASTVVPPPTPNWDPGVSRSYMHEESGYGRETDWWSLGAMIYEMAYGVAPFFATDIRRTYTRIMDHEKYLKFHSHVFVSHDLISLLRGLLCQADERLGRVSILEITEHAFFRDTHWTYLHSQDTPVGLLLPQFTFNVPIPGDNASENGSFSDDSMSRAFAFSALFQSSSPGPATAQHPMITSVGLTPTPVKTAADAFIGFSWGPTINAFNDSPIPEESTDEPVAVFTSATQQGPLKPPAFSNHLGAPSPGRNFTTPARPSALFAQHTLPRSATVGRSTARRPFSDREAMKQLVHCVGMSARKRVLESGRKPRILPDTFKDRMLNKSGSFKKKELRFQPVAAPLPQLKIDIASVGDSSETGSMVSPSPSPRPMSAMSRRSATPTATISGAFATLQSLKSMETQSLSASTTSPFLLPPPMTATNTSFHVRPQSPMDDMFDGMRRRYNRLMKGLDDIQRDIEGLREVSVCFEG